MATVKICIRSARSDERFLLELDRHLKPMERAGLVEIYHEGKIRAGEQYEQDIRMYMQRAQIILPLLSCDFMASNAYAEVEQAWQYAQQTEMRIIPILLRAVDWKAGRLGSLKILPDGAIPVKDWKDRDHAWTAITKFIRVIAVELISVTPTDEQPESTTFGLQPRVECEHG